MIAKYPVIFHTQQLALTKMSVLFTLTQFHIEKEMCMCIITTNFLFLSRYSKFPLRTVKMCVNIKTFINANVKLHMGEEFIYFGNALQKSEVAKKFLTFG